MEPVTGQASGIEAEDSAEPETDRGVNSAQAEGLENQIVKPSGMLESVADDTREGPAVVRSIEYRTRNDSTKIVIEIDGDADYTGERISGPDRIFFDISAATLGAGLRNRSITVKDKRLKKIRVAQNRLDVVRVVFDISAVDEYSISELQDPTRMVIDLHGPLGAESEPELQETDPSRTEADPDVESTQVVDLEEKSMSLITTGTESYPSGGAMQPSSSPPLSVNSSQVPAETDEAAIPPRPIARSVVQSAGLSFMQAKPFTVSGILTTGYYSAYTRGGSNSTQRINFIPASADFNVNGYFLTPDLIDYSFQPELNASPQANDAGFQGGNGIRMRINTLRRQPFPVSFHYTNVNLENVYFGSLSQLSSYTLNNRTRELGLTTQLRYAGLPTATMDWGTNSVLSQSFIPEIPDYVSQFNHRNIDVNYRKWGWDFRGFASRQQQTSNLYMPAGAETNSSILYQKLKQYRGSARWSFFQDLELSMDAGSQATSNFLLNRPINLNSRHINMDLRVFQRRRWKTSLRAGYTSNISDLLLAGLVSDLSGSGSIAPDDSILLPIQRTATSLNLGGFTSVDLSHGLSVYASADRNEVSPAGDRDLRSRYFTTSGGISYSKIFSWGNLSAQYGRSYGNGSVTGQKGRIYGQNYVVTAQPGKWEFFQLDFSVRGKDQRIVNDLPVYEKSLTLDGNVGIRLFGRLRTRVGGGWQKSDLTNAENSFKTTGYTARAAVEHPRFHLIGSLNSALGNPLQAYDRIFGEIGTGSTLLTPVKMTLSYFHGYTLTLYAVPLRILELSATYTRSIQHLEGMVSNDFETIDASAKFHFRNLKLDAGYFRSRQIYTSILITYPETRRGRLYIRISRDFKF